MEGGQYTIKLNKLKTSIRLYGINQRIAIVGAKCLHSTGIDNRINISNIYRISLYPENNIEYANNWLNEPILNANHIEISLGNPGTDIGKCYVILDYMVI
jgi:hypothetical protein